MARQGDQQETGGQPMSGGDAIRQALTRYVFDSEVLFSALLDMAGRIRTCSAGALRILQVPPEAVEGKSLADYLTTPDAALLQQRLAFAAVAGDEPLLLNVVGLDNAPVSLRCRLFAADRGVFFIGERLVDNEEPLAGELLQLNNHLAVLTREITRKNKELARRSGELEERNRQLEEANRMIERLARQDSLTGVANRRHFDERLAVEAERGKRLGTLLAIVMLDLDHFKTVNDRYGHAAGDAILVAVAAFLQEAIRPYDFVARLGGEEFVILLPGAGLENGKMIADRLRQGLELLVVGGYPQQITASFGVALLAPGATPAQVLLQADAALYRAKAAGRNRVECASEGGA